jgi:hypothetical protein
VRFYDRRLRTIPRTGVEVYEADNAIDNVALRQKANGRTRLRPRLATDYNQICQYVLRQEYDRKLR